jgi:FKBP-type peptidyl-prolyl cis-trans isomerase
MRLRILPGALALTLGAIAVSGCQPHKQEDKAAVSSTTDLTPASNKKFLADNALKPGVTRTADGLQYRVIKSGSGKRVTGPSDMVTVTYKGQLINGKVFDQTAPGKTAQFPAGGLIPGWVEALSLMKEGDEWELVIPSDLGYGSQGAGGAIPPDQTLVFEMTLVSVASAQ